MVKSDINEVFGLPEDLIDTEAFSREQLKLKVRVDKRKFGRLVTIITGFDDSIDIKALAKRLKKKLGCGGTAYDNTIELQGDHRKKIKQLLIEEGFREENIEVL